MNTEKPITLQRDCDAVMVPSGEPASLLAGSTVWLTQALGGTYTVMTEHGYSVRIDGHRRRRSRLCAGSGRKLAASARRIADGFDRRAGLESTAFLL